MGQGRRRIVGLSADMDAVTQERLANVHLVTRMISTARGTDRVLLREPDDAALDGMLERVHALEALLQADAWLRLGSARW